MFGRNSTNRLEKDFGQLLLNIEQMLLAELAERTLPFETEEKKTFSQRHDQRAASDRMEHRGEFEDSAERFDRLTQQIRRLLFDEFQRVDHLHLRSFLAERFRGENISQNLFDEKLFRSFVEPIRTELVEHRQK